ncbi:G-protein coupled receptor 171 [Pholidichthys leucotaenia]
MLQPNFTQAGADEEQQCIVNDQMVPFTVFDILIFIIGLPGNLLSAWVFIRCPRTKQQQQSSSVYLVNLLTANLLLLLTLPFKIMKNAGKAPWKLMVFHCQVSAVGSYISLYASVAFLALIITDQYLKNSSTVRSLWLQEVGFSRLLSVVIWLLLLLIMVPNMALPIQTVKEHRYLSCSSLKTTIGLHWHTLTVFLCTALFLNASASVLISGVLSLRRLLRGRRDPKQWSEARQTATSVTVMALAYTLSFVPYHAVRTPYTLTQAKVITDCATKRQLFLGKEATLLLSMLHLCFDPLLFFYLHDAFRETLGKMLPQSRKNTKEVSAETTQTEIQTTTSAQMEADL